MDSRDRQDFSWFGDDAFVVIFGENSLIVLPGPLRGPIRGSIRAFAVHSVVDKCSDGNSCRELRDAAGMVRVIVREQNKINFGDASQFCSGDDAVRVAAIVIGPARID